MAFSILLLFGVAIWLCYEYLTDASYHARKSDARKIERRHKDWDAGYKKLIKDGWTYLEPYAYKKRKEEILSKLERDDEETLKRTGLKNPPLVSSAMINKPRERDPGIFSLGYLLRCIHYVELSLIDYNEKIMNYDNASYLNGLPNHERDVRFYNWLKEAYDLYLMPHQDFILRIGKILPADDLVCRTDVIRKYIGNLPDPDYGIYFKTVLPYTYIIGERDCDGNWCILAEEVIREPYTYWYPYTYNDLQKALSRTILRREDQISMEEINLHYKEARNHLSYYILRYKGELLRGKINPSFVDEEVIRIMLPDFADREDLSELFSPGVILASSEWRRCFWYDTYEEAELCADDKAESHWEKDKDTGDYVLCIEAYAVFGRYKKIDTGEIIFKNLHIAVNAAEALTENSS